MHPFGCLVCFARHAWVLFIPCFVSLSKIATSFLPDAYSSNHTLTVHYESYSIDYFYLFRRLLRYDRSTFPIPVSEEAKNEWIQVCKSGGSVFKAISIFNRESQNRHSNYLSRGDICSISGLGTYLGRGRLRLGVGRGKTTRTLTRKERTRNK